MELVHLNRSIDRRASGSDVRTLRTISDWSLLGERLHGVQFYEDDEVLADLVSRFVGTALVTGDSAIVLATRRHRDAVAERLHNRGLDVSVAEKQGRYIPLDAARMLAKIVRNGRPDLLSFGDRLGKVLDAATRAAESGRQRVAVFGDIVALLWADGKIDAALQFEELWNKLAEHHAFSLCCAYPMKVFAGSMHAAPFLKICAQHSHVFPAERRLRATAASSL